MQFKTFKLKKNIPLFFVHFFHEGYFSFKIVKNAVYSSFYTILFNLIQFYNVGGKLYVFYTKLLNEAYFLF